MNKYNKNKDQVEILPVPLQIAAGLGLLLVSGLCFYDYAMKHTATRCENKQCLEQFLYALDSLGPTIWLIAAGLVSAGIINHGLKFFPRYQKPGTSQHLIRFSIACLVALLYAGGPWYPYIIMRTLIALAFVVSLGILLRIPALRVDPATRGRLEIPLLVLAVLLLTLTASSTVGKRNCQKGIYHLCWKSVGLEEYTYKF
ncbi:hypothetical protein [Mangrovicoccus sp. HB161399]|uniref:hypothetical protein n=1 Tax=Mangrovicoccus sp. HB161399 TaxID=2720392 RepID=UPI001556A218|nr:hypothetical protein [Mangrovicoccus sp. HB161399]